MAARIKDRYKLFECKPALGGNLVTRGSADNAGVFNYVTKRDWRRDLDVEQRREGHDYFYPNLSLPIGGQPFPSQIQLDGLTFSGGYATGTRIMGHWFEIGETIIVTGAADPIYNGTHTVTAVGPTTFSYGVTGIPASPDVGTAIFAQAQEEITLLALARRPNGQTAVIAGSQRRLYRYYALEDPDYISHDPADYPAGTATDQLSYWSDGIRYAGDRIPPQAAGFWGAVIPPVSEMAYVDENPGYWIVIGSGFSLQGRRWETVSINGYMVFNNGVDLPCTYRVEDLEVVPIYEMREQGIASVGTISEINGILMLGDITEIQANKVPIWFQTAGRILFDSLTFNIVDHKVTATRGAGQPFQVGDSITVSGAVHAEYNGNFIVTDSTPTTLKYVIVGSPATPDPTAFPYIISNRNQAPYGIYTDTQYLTRTTFRVAWGVPGEPRRWSPLYPGSIDAGSNVLRLSYAVLGLSPGQNITIVGAGASHAGGTVDNLAGNIIYIDGVNVILDSFAQTSVKFTTVQTTDSIGSIVGFEDLQDDGSGILKMLPMADQLVIYKDTSIFLAQYLGTATQPFAFGPRRIQKEQSLFYRNTLWLVETPTEMFHIYAGRNSFYRFDLTNQQPMIQPHFESCSNIFFSQATLANTEKIFAAENGITHEILFVFPITQPAVNAVDQMLCYDYKQDSISTSSALVTSAATVRKPITGLASGAEEDWCLLGTPTGTVLLYGLTNQPQAAPDWNGGEQIFFRRDANPYSATTYPYDSVLVSGLASFGNDYAEKDMRAFVVLMASQSPDISMTVNVYGTQNANLPVALVATKHFTNPQTRNLLPLLSRQFYFQSSITVTLNDLPCRLVGTLWNVAGIDSRSLPRG